MSSSRAASLASAAVASSRLAQTYPMASPVASSSSLFASQPRIPKGKKREQDHVKILKEEEHEEDYDDEDDSTSILSSRQKRLSRAARHGSSYSSTIVHLPDRFAAQIKTTVDQSNKQVLRQDYLKMQNYQKTGKGGYPKFKGVGRMVPLHLSIESSQRYAAIQSVLRQVKARLCSDEEGLASNGNHSWYPSRIIEYNCRAGEGLWAAREVFGSAKETKEGVSSYFGMDEKTPLLRTIIDFITSTNVSPDEEGNGQDDSTERESSIQNITKQPAVNLDGIKVSLKPHLHTPDPFAGTLPLELNSTPDHGGTMILCSGVLLKQLSDKHRLKFISSLWKDHPEAEVLVFIEEASERGFAAIASAREHLLGIDSHQQGQEEEEGESFQLGRHTFYDEKSTSQLTSKKVVKKVPDWHVVAPCPHDKPCPLLHDYVHSGPPTNPTTRTSRATSPLFHGANLGMDICSFPLRLHRPEATKLTTHESRSVESSRYSYIVVKRGPRPSIAQEARKVAKDGDKFVEQRHLMRQAAKKTKKGDIEEIRAGSKKDDIMLAEEIQEGDADNVAAAMTFDEKDGERAKEALLKLLPEALKKEMKQHDETVEMEEAFQLAHEMMKKSADMGEEERDSIQHTEHQDIDLTSAFLDQARQLNTDQKEELSQDDSILLLPGDIEAMKIESYQWPRLVQRAIKKSGHVTFDVCSCEGSIDRFTVSKSTGKQVYQDARKSNWGDAFPHVAFNEEGEDHVSIKSLITRVPSAGIERSGLPAVFKFVGRGKKRNQKPENYNTLTSPLAIGPDRVFPTPLLNPYSKTAKSRRDHLDRSGRGEKLQLPKLEPVEDKVDEVD